MLPRRAAHACNGPTFVSHPCKISEAPGTPISHAAPQTARALLEINHQSAIASNKLQKMLYCTLCIHTIKAHVRLLGCTMSDRSRLMPDYYSRCQSLIQQALGHFNDSSRESENLHPTGRSHFQGRQAGDSSDYIKELLSLCTSA
jgi:hypothetical protein